MPAGLELLEVSVIVFLLQGYLVTGHEVTTCEFVQRNMLKQRPSSGPFSAVMMRSIRLLLSS